MKAIEGMSREPRTSMLSFYGWHLPLVALLGSVLLGCVALNQQVIDVATFVPEGNETDADVSSAKSFADPVSVRAQRLPPNFVGDDPKTIFDSLYELRGPRSEFETTEEFEKRIHTMPNELLGRPVAASVFAAMIYKDSAGVDGQLAPTYDADQGTMLVPIRIGLRRSRDLGGWFPPPDFRKAIVLSENLEHASEITVRNGFGAESSGYSTAGTSLCLSFVNFQDFGIDHVSSEVQFAVPMNVEQAKSAKEQLRVLAVFCLCEPFVAASRKNETATLDVPFDSSTKYCLLYGAIQELWFVNEATGEIYGKLQRESQ